MSADIRSERSQHPTSPPASIAARLLLPLKRPSDYSDVHAELVAEHAVRPNLLRDDVDEMVVVSLDRPEKCERADTQLSAADMIAPT